MLIVAFGLIRSIPMLHVTIMRSLETYAPVGARLTVRAFCRASEVAAVHARLNRTTLPLQSIALFDLRTHTTSPPTLGHTPAPHPCAGAPDRNRLSHQNELEAAQLLLHLHDWSAGTVVVWRIDTELVSPIESVALMPWQHPRRVYVPYLQSGGFLNDRFLLGHPYPIKLLLQAREALIASRCTYGEPALMHVIQTLNLSVSFTRTRVVRRRQTLAVPAVDAIASLGQDRARPWMKNINSLPQETICSQRSCEKPRPSEQPFCRVVGFNRIFPWGAGRNFTFVESADKTQRQTQRRGGARLQRGKANTSTASKATTIKVTRVATTTATAAVAAAMRMMEADNYADPSQRSDGPFAPQKRRLRTRTPASHFAWT